jgi:protein-S-isoprenylcysteine O-methyltransferase Ste14
LSQTPAEPGHHPLRLLLHVPVPWVYVLTYLAGVGLELLRSDGPRSAPAAVGIAGVLLFAAGAAIAGWSLVLFHREGTTTVPGRTSARLVTWGPYRYTRNPMYVSLGLAYLGEAGILKHVWPVVLLPLTLAYVNGVVIPVEEARLAQTFGEEYAAYRSRVRRWI